MQRQQSGGRTRALIFLFGSLFLAFVAASIVWNVIRRSQEQIKEAQKPKATVDVVIAVRDLYMGLPITKDDIVVRQVLPEMIPREETFEGIDQVEGRTPRERILANEPIREDRLARADAGVGLNAIVTPGRRAMTVATDTETAVAGLLQAGNFVDFIVTIKPEDPTAVGGKYVAETILQEIKVLAVGSSLGGNAAKEEEAKEAKKSGKASDAAKKLKPSITVEVTPEEAEKLALAMTRGEIHVVLRSDIDILKIDSQGPTTADGIIGYASTKADTEPIKRRRDVAAAPPPPVPTAEVIQGGDRTQVTFEADGTKSENTDKGKRKPK